MYTTRVRYNSKRQQLLRYYTHTGRGFAAETASLWRHEHSARPVVPAKGPRTTAVRPEVSRRVAATMPSR